MFSFLSFFNIWILRNTGTITPLNSKILPEKKFRIFSIFGYTIPNAKAKTDGIIEKNPYAFLELFVFVTSRIIYHIEGLNKGKRNNVIINITIIHALIIDHRILSYLISNAFL